MYIKFISQLKHLGMRILQQQPIGSWDLSGLAAILMALGTLVSAIYVGKNNIINHQQTMIKSLMDENTALRLTINQTEVNTANYIKNQMIFESQLEKHAQEIENLKKQLIKAKKPVKKAQKPKSSGSAKPKKQV